MQRLAAAVCALLLVAGCNRHSDAPKSIALNTIESVTSKQVLYEGEPWVEVTLSQRVDPNAPAYVTGIRDSKWANRLSWGLIGQTLSPDKVVTRFRFKPANDTNEIILTRDDFEWFPPISGFQRVVITLKGAEANRAATQTQPVGSKTNRTSSVAGPRTPMNDTEFAAWNSSKRTEVIAYLETQGISKPQVGDWPAFEIAPHFGIWCVESKKQKGKIGWWAFAGDCPTDYVSEDGQCNPRAALTNLLRSWKDCIPYMKAGNQPPHIKFGDHSNIKELGELLEKRVVILEEWLADDSLWEER